MGPTPASHLYKSGRRGNTTGRGRWPLGGPWAVVMMEHGPSGQGPTGGAPPGGHEGEWPRVPGIFVGTQMPK